MIIRHKNFLSQKKYERKNITLGHIETEKRKFDHCKNLSFWKM